MKPTYEELEKQNAILKKFWKQLYEAIEREEQKDGYCRLFITKEQLLFGKKELDEFLSNNDLLTRLETLEKAYDLACDSQVECPTRFPGKPWDCIDKACHVKQCWKEYFIKKAGDSQ